MSELELYSIIGAIMEHQRKGLKLADFSSGKVRTIKVRFREGEQRTFGSEVMNMVGTLRRFGALHQFILAWRALLDPEELRLLQKGAYMEIVGYTLQQASTKNAAPSTESQPAA